MKKTFINELKSGQSVNDIFAIRDLQVLNKKNGDPYLSFTLLDKTGEIQAVAWDRVEEFRDLLTNTTYAQIDGKVSSYMNALQFIVRDIKLVSLAEVDPKNFLPVTEKNIEMMFNRLGEIFDDNISPRGIYRSFLVNMFFNDSDFVDSFKTAPGAKTMHHAYIGGLLEHTLAMVEMGVHCIQHIPDLNSDLLITGIIFHDIGKIREYTYDSPPIDISDEGRLLGHIPIGLQMLNEKLIQMPQIYDPLEFENAATQLRHMIISHHGCREWGSPEPPKTLEAIVLHHLDMLDSQVAAVKSFIDQYPGPGWTRYHKVFDRYFFKKGESFNERTNDRIRI